MAAESSVKNGAKRGWRRSLDRFDGANANASSAVVDDGGYEQQKNKRLHISRDNHSHRSGRTNGSSTYARERDRRAGTHHQHQRRGDQHDERRNNEKGKEKAISAGGQHSEKSLSSRLAPPLRQDQSERLGSTSNVATANDVNDEEEEDEETRTRRIRRLRRRRRSAGLDSDVSEDELLRWSSQMQEKSSRIDDDLSTVRDRKIDSENHRRPTQSPTSPNRGIDRREDRARRWRMNDRESDRAWRIEREQRQDEEGKREPRRSEDERKERHRDEGWKAREERYKDTRATDVDRRRSNVRETERQRGTSDRLANTESNSVRSNQQSRLRSRSPSRSSQTNRSPEAVLLRRRRSRSPRSQSSPSKEIHAMGRRDDNRNRHDHPSNGHEGMLCTERRFSEAESSRSVLPARASADEVYEHIAQVGEGTYGQVFKAKSDRTGVLVALKKIRMESERDGFPITAMREVKLLQGLRHENVVRLHEMMLSKHSIYMVFEYLEHDLNGVLAQPSIVFTPAHLKSLAAQLLSGLAYLHTHSILHRDLKCSNLLLNNEGTLKLADFGLARSYTKQARAPRKRTLDYTNRVVTLWYRAPELLFGETSYGDAIDVWGAGCIFMELFMRRPTFQGNDEIHQVQLLFDLLGPVTKEEWPEAEQLPWFDLVRLSSTLEESQQGRQEPEQEQQLLQQGQQAQKHVSHAEHLQRSLDGTGVGKDVVEVACALLAYNPRTRISAQEALQMLPYFCANEPKAEKPAQLLQSVKGEWHEFESRRARRDAAAQALHAHVHRERHQEQEQEPEPQLQPQPQSNVAQMIEKEQEHKQTLPNKDSTTSKAPSASTEHSLGIAAVDDDGDASA